VSDDRPQPVPSTLAVSITPELVLVDPELAELARAALPDRPWESFLPPPPAPVLPEAVAERPAFPVPLADPPRRARRPAPAPEPLEAGVPRSERRTARRILNGALAVAAVVGIAHLGAWESGGERLLPPETTASPVPRRSAAAVGSGGYVISPAGGFRTSSGGRSLLEIRLPVRCGGRQIVVRRADIGRNGAFRYVGRAVDSRYRVTLEGRFVEPGHVQGAFAVQGTRCRAARTFHARLS
jgi:hypothetical protein